MNVEEKQKMLAALIRDPEVKTTAALGEACVILAMVHKCSCGQPAQYFLVNLSTRDCFPYCKACVTIRPKPLLS